MADFDKIIRNGTIVDGTGGTPAFRGDVAIKNGKIAMISGSIKGSAKEELDATGCIVAPGAIDLHTLTTISNSTGNPMPPCPAGTG